MIESTLPPLRYLNAADVMAAMPPLPERLRLAELTMRALVPGTPQSAELPPKIGVHPRPADSFAHAMPAFLPGSAADGSEDYLGMKWITGFPANRGIPGLNGIVLLNDPRTGLPVAIVDGGPITAQRTAGVSGLAIREWAPRIEGRPVRVGLIGAGAQARSHLVMLGALLPGATIRLFDSSRERADALAAEAQEIEGLRRVETVGDARSAVEGADVVITAAAFGPIRQVMTNDWLEPEVLVIPIDYATYCSAEVARGASLFLTDERGQLLANRDAGLFDNYPDPMATIGEALIAGTPRPAGRIVVTHLGVGLADVVFANAVLRIAEERGLGIVLPR